ncbi:putative hydrolase of the HAD superfamily [Crossiella equi]|uniref:Hydrolase of the HAD superfamily n=1 Tax=Crossiella equi TaxID=130796 RepID=A0ABS5AGR8_9PSEU|nr:HAD-IA family hydrolase [Crossiella equi]MBP2475771.1 putative hydrolase of the HAD superfamily [Crossiella equi]
MHWVVFDFGEVLSVKTRALPGLATHYGVSTVDFEAAYWAEREAYDRGLPAEDYWRRLGTRLGVEVDQETAAALSKADWEGWLEFDPAAFALFEELHGQGVPLALLSNAPSEFGRAVEARPWSANFRTMLFSGDLGCAKPDAEIWAELLRRTGAPAGDHVFFDDRQVNVDGALAAGINARLWRGAEDARTFLAGLSGSGSAS